MAKMRKRDYDYFDYFISCAQMALDAAKYLDEVFNNFRQEIIVENVDTMHRIENDADKIKHEMLEHLAREFMPPIEREDVVALAQQMDNVVDSIEDVMRRFYMYDITALRSDTTQLSALIVRCCDSLLNVAREFPQFKKKDLRSLIIAVNTIESEGDRLHSACMRKLFTDGTDLREVTVWMTMYDCLENCLDACEDAADIIESIIMKNS